MLSESDFTRVGWIYRDDLGEEYSTNTKNGLAKQADTEGRPLIGGRPPADPMELYRIKHLASYPKLKVRTVTVVNLENGRRRTVVVHSRDAPLWIGTTTTIEMQENEPIEGDSQHVYLVARPFHVRGRKEEIYQGRRPKAPAPPVTAVPAPSENFDSIIEEMFAKAWKSATTIIISPQHRVLDYRIDFAHLPTRTAIELDGYYYHADTEHFRKDRQRDRALTELGWRVVRFAADEILADVDRCVDQVLRMIGAVAPGNSSSP